MERGNDLDRIIFDLKSYPGYTRKSVIGSWVDGVVQEGANEYFESIIPIGDDAGAIELNNGFLLVSAEALMPSLFDDPYFAGFCGVTVCVNDIYAMGGRPLGMLVIIFAGGFNDMTRELFLKGFSSALKHYSLPLLGGHTSPEGKERFAAVAIAGYSKSLLRGDGAKPGDSIVIAVDLSGRMHPSFYAWDTVTCSSSTDTHEKLSCLLEVAEKGLCSSCRDISNPGLVGTTAMLLETSGCGARLYLERVPKPENVDFLWWLKAYPSYGFIMTAQPENIAEISEIFNRANIACEAIGEVTGEKILYLIFYDKTEVFIDYSEESVTGISRTGL